MRSCKWGKPLECVPRRGAASLMAELIKWSRSETPRLKWEIPFLSQLLNYMSDRLR